MRDHTCVGVTPFFPCKFLNSHGLGSVLGSVLRGARGQKKTNLHWKVHVFLHNHIMIVHWYAVLVGAGPWLFFADLTGEIHNTLYSSFLFCGSFYVTFCACCFAVALFETSSKPFFIVSLFSIIAMHPLVNLHLFFFLRGGSNAVGTSPQPPSIDVGDHKHSFGSPN